MRVLVLGASGTAGQATAQALARVGHDLTFILRPGAAAPLAAKVLRADPREPAGFRAAMIEAAPDAVVSCLASRTGAPRTRTRICQPSGRTAPGFMMPLGSSASLIARI
ncbi:MAG: NAD-dependent epimerase/dehydratase family protein, partial [Pseudomonadota bacterium]